LTLRIPAQEKGHAAIAISMFLADARRAIAERDPGRTSPTVGGRHIAKRLVQSWRTNRKMGEALSPEREPLDVLEELKLQIGSDAFSAQYQQQPASPGGTMVKCQSVKRYLESRVSGIIAVKPEGDKASRMAVASAKFEAGQVLLPERATRLPDLAPGGGFMHNAI
jgi:hypothetical protein